MHYKPQIFTDEVLQCVFDKYVITYHNIRGKGMIRPHLVESNYFKTLALLKGAPILHHFFTEKMFLLVTATEEEISKMMKLTNIYYQYLRAARFPGKWGNVALIHSMSFKHQIYTNGVLQCLVDKYVITYQNI